MSEPAAQKRILLVDDERAVRDLFQIALEKRGLVVLTADGTRTAMQLAHDLTFDIAIVDLNLLEGDGLDLIRHLVRNYPAIRVLAMSGDPAAEKRLLAQGINGVRFHDKLAPLTELIGMIESG